MTADDRPGTVVYVDGLNLYYGSLRGTPYRWLDLAALSRLLLPAHRISRIKYFTARVRGHRGEAGAPRRQETYLRALRTVPEIEIIYGHFLVTEPTMPLAEAGDGRRLFARVVKTEEKGSDVNLAAHLVHDAHLGRYEAAAVISNDSDLAEALRLVRRDLGLVVGVLNPHRKVSSVLRRHSSFVKQIRKGVLSKSQLPDEVSTPSGIVRRPASW